MMMTASPQPSGATRSTQPLWIIFSALVLVVLLAALDQTIVSTALPTIVGEMGGLSHLSWVVTAYLLSSTVVGPLYGKLGDLFGRKVVLQTAIVLFLVGSALCGAAQSMPQLIAFRIVQGLGGGGLIVTAMAVVGDIVSPRERGRYHGLFGGAFAFATVAGPLAGGFFVEQLSWRWIFYINLPLGLIVLAVIGLAFPATQRDERPAIDYAGAALLAGSLSSIVLFTSLGGVSYPWSSEPILLLIALSAALSVAFFLVEARAKEPLLPLSLFRNPIFTVAGGVSAVVGVALFGCVTYLPLYLQVVKGQSPTDSGLLLTPMMGGILLTSITAGQLISRFGRYKPFPVVGTALVTVALFLLSRLTVETTLLRVGLDMVVLGLGLGMVMQVLVLAVQNGVEYKFLGVATSGVMLFRLVGGSIGVSLFGAIFANRLEAELTRAGVTHAGVPLTGGPAALETLPPEAHDAFAQAVTAALSPVFLSGAALAAFAFLLALSLREAPLRKTAPSEGMSDSFAMPRDADSLRELERIVTTLAESENHWRVYARLAERAGFDLTPPEVWLLARLSERSEAMPHALAREMNVDAPRLTETAEQLKKRRLLRSLPGGGYAPTEEGQGFIAKLTAARRAALCEILECWKPEEHAEVRALLDRLSEALVSEMPMPPVAKAA